REDGMPKRYAYRRPTILKFLDFKNAFDSVDLLVLFNALALHVMPQKFVYIVRCLKSYNCGIDIHFKQHAFESVSVSHKISHRPYLTFRCHGNRNQNTIMKGGRNLCITVFSRPITNLPVGICSGPSVCPKKDRSNPNSLNSYCYDMGSLGELRITIVWKKDESKTTLTKAIQHTHDQAREAINRSCDKYTWATQRRYTDVLRYARVITEHRLRSYYSLSAVSVRTGITTRLIGHTKQTRCEHPQKLVNRLVIDIMELNAPKGHGMLRSG
ncbi:hypothetical protein CLF_105831, partial [Clonorchis sinensis]